MRKTNYNSLERTGLIVQKTRTITQSDAKLVKPKIYFSLKCILVLLILVFSLSVNAQNIAVSATNSANDANYTTLKLAFDAINAGTHTGTVSITVNGNTTETATAVLNSSGTGSASYTSVNIKPATGLTPTISGSIAGSAIIKLSGADFVTIDGSNTVGGSTRDLTITNTAIASSTAAIWLGSLSGNGATNNTIKNCIIGCTSRVTCLAGIISSSNTTISATGLAGNNNNTYSNNLVQRASNAIALLGFSTSPYDVGVTVNGNNVDSAMAASILISNQSSFNVYNNIIDKQSNLSTGTANVIGMSFTNNHGSGNVYNNKILYVRQNQTTGANSARGVSFNSAVANTGINFYNNFINDVSAYGGNANNLAVVGMYVSLGGGYKIYNNTVHLITDPVISSVFVLPFATGGLSGSSDIRNNTFSSQITYSALYQAKSYCYYFLGSFATAPMTSYGAYFSNFDNNNFYTNYPTLAYTNATTTGAMGNLAAMQAEYAGFLTNSTNVSPVFNSSTDLHLQAVAGNASLNNAGVPVTSVVTTDIDGTTRSVNYPDIGADEIIYTPKIANFSPANACAGSTVTINGADFTGASAVSLAGASAASYTVVSTSQITATVAGGYTSPNTDVVSVTNGFGSANSSTNLTRLAPGTYTSKSLSTGSTGDQVIITGTNLGGATAVSFGGTSASFTISNSTEIVSTVPAVGNGTVTITITDACGNSVNAGSFTVVTANPCSTPTAQATNFVQSSLSTSTMNGTFSGASGSPSGYVVVYSTSALSSLPVDGSTYTAGAGFGGTIKQVSASTNVNLTGLVGNTTYTVTIFAYNGGGCTGGPLYNTTNPLTYTFTTCSNVPTSVSASPVVTSNVNNINFSWGAPSGGGANSITYQLDVTTDAGYTSHVSGSPFSTNQLSATATNLNFATKYYYRIISNNGCSSNYVSGNVTTGCGSGTVLPYTQNFDGVITPALPSCWTFEDYNNDGVKWFTSVPFIATGHSTPTVLRYNRNTATPTVAADDWAFTPGFQLTGGVSYTLSFLEGTYSNGENLQVRYGTSASSAAMPVGNTLWSGSGLTNQTFAAQYGTFTPTSSGVYYFGFYTNSPSSNNGGLYLYVDNIKLQVTPGAPNAPSSLTASNIASTSVNLTWTDNATNEEGFNIYTSTDGVNYDLVNTIYTPNLTSTTVSNLASSTQYWFKVTAFNFGGGEGAGATTTATTLACSSYTTNTWIGPLVSTGENWASAGNWSLGHQPTSCEDVVISPIMSIVNATPTNAATAFIGLNNNTVIHDLTIAPTDTGIAAKNLYIYSDIYSLAIRGNLSISSNRTNNTTVTTDYALLAAGLGNITVSGTASIGNTGNRFARTGSDGSGASNITFKGDVTFGPNASFNAGSVINYVFDAPGAQSVTMNSTVTGGGNSFGMGSVTIGSTNTPTVTWTDSLTTTGVSGISDASRVVNDLTINAGSSLILNSGTALNRTVSGGTFTLGSGASLTVKGSTSGVGNSNFPSNFGTHSFANSSTVVYNGSSAQTLASAPGYGNLTVNNASGVALNGNTSVAGALTLTSGVVSTGSSTLTLGLNGSVTGASSARYINGTLAKTKAADTNGFLNFEIGDASQYTPVFVGFNGVTNSGGIFSAKTTSGAPAALGYLRSGISSTEYLNRTYTLGNNGVTGHTSIYPVFTYANADLISAGTPSNSNYYIADSIYGGGWSLRTGTNNSTPSSAATVSLSNGQTAVYLMGELDPAPAPTVDEPTPSSACEGSSYVITGSNFYGISNVSIGSTSVSYTVNSPSQITITVPVNAISGKISVTNSTATATTVGSLTVNAQPQTTVSVSSQTVCSGSSITTIVLGNSGNISGTTYSWTRTGNNSAVSGSTSGNSDISGSFNSTSTIPETLTYVVTSSANGCSGTTVNTTVTVKASPGVVSVTPGSSAICQNSTQQLDATVTAATGSSVKNSGAISVVIPDNNFGGSFTTLNVNDVPSGAIITGIDVNLNVTSTFNGDLVLNLTAPNGKTLNLVNREGGAGVNFTNTVVSSASSNAFQGQGVDSSNMTETWAADLMQGVGPVALSSNALTWSQLYGTPNGNWKLSGRDYVAGNEATITNWSLTIYYTLNPTFVWAPTTGLYTDAGFTAYTGGNQHTVYVKNTPGNYSYNANISFNGCTASSNTATVDIEAVPNASRTPVSQTVCSGTAITDIVLSSPNDPTATLTWTRDHSEVTGVATSGSGNITGTLNNTTAAPVTVTFTITPNGTGSVSCPGTPVTATVTVNPIPLASVSPSSQNACSGSAIDPLIFLTTNGVAGTTFAWTRDNTSAATGIGSSGTAFVSGTLTNASTATTVTFYVTAVGPSPAFCAGAPTTATVNVMNPASAYSMTGGGNFCTPATSGASVGLSNSQVGYNYQLYKNGTATGSPVAGTGSALSFGLQDVGTYTAVASNGGCSTNMTGSVTVTSTSSATPTISISTATVTVCSGSNVTFSSSITNGGSTPSYAWKKNGTTVGTNSSYTFAPNSLSTGDQITCILTSSNACVSTPISSNTITLTVNPSPAIAAIKDASGSSVSSKVMCTLGSTYNLYCATPGGTWSSSSSATATITTGYTGSTPQPQVATVKAIANGLATISYTLPPVNGCASSSTVAINVNSVATPDPIVGSSSICVGANSTYTTTSTGGVWSTAGRATINGSGSATGTSAGATSIKYTIINSDGCSASSSLAVTVNAQPAVPSIAYAPGTVSPQGSGGYCANRTFTIVGNPTGGTWSKTGVISITSGGVVSTGPSAGPMSVTYTVTNANGCTNSRTIAGNVVICPARGVMNTTIASDNNFTMYPNPANSIVKIQINKLVGEGQIIVTDALGKQVIAQPLSMGTNNLDVTKLSKGFYLVTVVTTEGRITKKLIKE